MNVLILGSQGFIGNNLVNQCIHKGYTVTGCDLVEINSSVYNYHKVSILSSDFDALLSAQNFDVCINASGSGNVSYSMLHPLSDFEYNSLAVVKVLDCIRKYQPSCKYLHISSAAVYGNPKKLPILETDLPSPLSPYGYHKWISEITCREYHSLYELPISIIRPFSVYGRGLRKQLLWDICSRLKDADSIELFGTGHESRDFIHISDLVALIIYIIEKCDFTCKIYNAASGTESTIRQIADIFEDKFQPAKKITFSGVVRSGDPLNWKADLTMATSLGFAPHMTLENGVTDFIEWVHSL